MTKLKKGLEALARGLRVQHALRARAVHRMAARHREQVKAERQAKAARRAATALRRKIGSGIVELAALDALTRKAERKEHKAERLARRAATALRRKIGSGIVELAALDALTRKAERKEHKAERLDAKADKAKRKAIAEKRRAKRKTQQIHKLRVRADELEHDLRQWEATHGPHVGKDGKVAGADSKGEGFIWVNKRIAAECASGERPTFYSMSGSGFNVTHALLKRNQPHTGQIPGERSDCSLFGTETCLASRLPDPNDLGYKAGYTGSALQAAIAGKNGWKVVSERAMRAKGWGIVIYLRWPGDTVGHHWEDYVGEGGDGTIGHGSAPIDPGVINLFGDGLYACVIFDPK